MGGYGSHDVTAAIKKCRELLHLAGRSRVASFLLYVFGKGGEPLPGVRGERGEGGV